MERAEHQGKKNITSSKISKQGVESNHPNHLCLIQMVSQIKISIWRQEKQSFKQLHILFEVSGHLENTSWVEGGLITRAMNVELWKAARVGRKSVFYRSELYSQLGFAYRKSEF